MKDVISTLEHYLTPVGLAKLLAIPNRDVHRFVAKAVDLCEPMKVFVCTDAQEDIDYIRRTAIARGEETELAINTQTVHFDGFFDQARDKGHTQYLVPKGESLGEQVEQIDRDIGLKEVEERMKGCMHNKKMVIRFFCLGPLDSDFSIPCVQITDSFYVAHSEDLLYRTGYEYFKRLPDNKEIFWMLHSSGKLVQSVSIGWQQRGVAIDYLENTVYSYNTQYAGNTIGLKKLALRLAIRKANREDWLAEHMFLMAIHGPEGRKTYLTGAYPSACGKTSTSMVKGATIVGDDLTYLRIINGHVRGVNVEQGIFGIIRSVSQEDDPVIWEVLNSCQPAIYSNVLITEEGYPHWLDDGRPIPPRGVNHSGPWWIGKVDEKGEEIPMAHKNARYTISLKGLPNLDSALEDPQGVKIGGIIYGGRDSDTWVPVQESFNWDHGVLTMGACLESKTTAATLGPSGVRMFQPFSNLDFISIPLGQYIKNHLKFGKSAQNPPRIFAVNYFQQNAEGQYITGKDAKRVWLNWMDRRIHGEVEAIKTPIGYIPRYEDLKMLFREILNKTYAESDYIEQFSIRVPELLEKIDRIEKIYHETVPDAPLELSDALSEQRVRLIEVEKIHGECIAPNKFTST
ncbi:MAG: phosphoenolpyruvate carboxykinase (GTP) [Candidatus Thorarchaeota archaeon]|nr:phosphoenolpyruvate carboxykinase (GTP) [Candidatus Thorarchaeota archaeon]